MSDGGDRGGWVAEIQTVACTQLRLSPHASHATSVCLRLTRDCHSTVVYVCLQRTTNRLAVRCGWLRLQRAFAFVCSCVPH